MASLKSYLPPHAGLLPLWLLLVSLLSVGNSIQAYSTTRYTSRVYSGPSAGVMPLQSRTFGTWTLLSSIVRLYAAYHIDDPVMYQLALCTYGIAWLHFVSEWLGFGTARWGKGLAGPVVISTGTLVWMVVQWGWYVR